MVLTQNEKYIIQAYRSLSEEGRLKLDKRVDELLRLDGLQPLNVIGSCYLEEKRHKKAAGLLPSTTPKRSR